MTWQVAQTWAQGGSISARAGGAPGRSALHLLWLPLNLVGCQKQTNKKKTIHLCDYHSSHERGQQEMYQVFRASILWRFIYISPSSLTPLTYRWLPVWTHIPSHSSCLEICSHWALTLYHLALCFLKMFSDYGGAGDEFIAQRRIWIRISMNGRKPEIMMPVLYFSLDQTHSQM